MSVKSSHTIRTKKHFRFFAKERDKDKQWSWGRLSTDECEQVVKNEMAVMKRAEKATLGESFTAFGSITERTLCFPPLGSVPLRRPIRVHGGKKDAYLAYDLKVTKFGTDEDKHIQSGNLQINSVILRGMSFTEEGPVLIRLKGKNTCSGKPMR